MDLKKLLVVNKSDFDDFSRVYLQNSKAAPKQPNTIKPIQNKQKQVSPMDMFKSKPPVKEVNKKQQHQDKIKDKYVMNNKFKKLLSESQDYQQQEEVKQTIISKKKKKNEKQIEKKIQKKLIQDIDQTQIKTKNVDDDNKKKSKNYLKDSSIYTTNQNQENDIESSWNKQKIKKRKQKSKKNVIEDSDNTDSVTISKKPSKKQKKQKLFDSDQENEVEKEKQSEQSNVPKTKKVKMTQVCKETITFKDQQGYLVTKQVSKEKEYWAQVKVATPTRQQPPRNGKNTKKPVKDSKAGQSTRSLSSYFKKAQ